MELLVSIVVAAYNAEMYIERCLECLINQTYANIEILVCDDCSSDNTLSIINTLMERDDRIHAIINDTNLRAAESRNRCIERSKGQYIMIQDSDDLCESNRVELLIASLIGAEDIDFVSSGHYLIDDSGIYKKVVPNKKKPEKNDFLYGLPFCHAATMFKTECLKAVGGYRVSKETRRGQDYDLFMRLYSRGYRGKNICDVLYGYRVDKNAIARRKLKYRIDECKIRYYGFKELGLLPKGFIYVLKPIAAHFIQIIRGK